MARPFQYGDPGQPDPTKNIMYWLGKKYRTGITPSRPGSSMGGVTEGIAEPGVLPVGFGGVQGHTGWVSPEQLAAFRSGAGLAGAVGYDPVQEMRYMGLGGGALPPPQVTTTSADQARYAPGVYYPAAPAPGTLPSASGNYPLAQYQNRNASAYDPLGGGGTTPAAGQREPISYETIREMEAGLKAAGYTGRDVFLPNKDEQDRTVSYDIIRRDNQGRVLRITRGVSGQTADLAFAGRSKNVGGGPGAKTEMRRHRGQERRVKTTGEKYSWQVPQPAPAPAPVSGNNYPNWVINMSNWRGI